MALVHVVRNGPEISEKHVGTDGTHRDESAFLVCPRPRRATMVSTDRTDTPRAAAATSRRQDGMSRAVSTAGPAMPATTPKARAAM